MTSDQSDVFLRRTLLQLLPDVFFHPVWLHLTRNIATYSPDFVQHILHNLELERNQDELVSNCEIIFICASLQSYLGEHTKALSSIEQAWILAETQGLQSMARCAAWGACAICIRRNNYEEATEWLSKLQQTFKEKHEWVLRDILEVVKQNIEAQTVYSSNEELSDILLRWGEWTPPETRGLSKDRHTIQAAGSPPAGIVSRLTRRWTAFWDDIRYGTRRGKLPQQLLHRSAVISKDEPSKWESLPELKASQPQKEVLSSTPAFLPENNPTPSEVSGLSDSLLQANATPASLPHPTASRQSSLPSLAVYCLGPFQAYQDEQLIENWLSRKALSVFKHLILEHPTPVVKEVLMDTFWPGSDFEAARRNLHQAIYALRQILRGDQQEFHHIFFKNDCYSLNPGLEIWIDFREFEKHINLGRRLDKAGQADKAIEQYGIAEGLYQGDFLEEDLYEDWPVIRREQLYSSYLVLVERLTEIYLQIGQYTSVTHLCHKVLAKDRCYEAVHRMLMQCYLAQGQRHLAVRQYQTCIRALREDLGISPSRETVDLYHRIAAKPRV
jgi:two-component SAPR family response regulator